MKEIDTNELSKSLVGGNKDFLPYYSESIKSKSRGCRTFPIMVSLLVVGLIVWLLCLTFVSQWQISNLETETTSLKLDIEKLKTQILDNDRGKNVKDYRDSVYSDDFDPSSSDNLDSDDVEFAGDVDKEPLKNIYGMMNVYQAEADTDDSDGDRYNDNDDDDDDYASGDWSYLDYDKNRPPYDEEELSNTGNHLPDDEDSDFLGQVMEAKSQEDSEKKDNSSIKKIMKIVEDESMEETGEDRRKRQINQTPDGWKIHTKSYKETHNTSKPDLKPGKTLYEKVAASKVSSGNRQKRHHFSLETPISDEESRDVEVLLPGMLARPNDLTEDAAPPGIVSRSSVPSRRVPLPHSAAPSMLRAPRESDYDEFEDEVTTTTAAPHRRRKLRGRTGAGGTLVAAHFAANTSHLELGKHEHYHGNGLLRLPDGETHSTWRAAAWLPALGADRHFRLDTDSGVIHVKLDGIYFVYAQIYFQDERDTNSFKVFRNDVEPILHCTTTTISTTRESKANTCFTAAAAMLHAGDRLAVRNVGGLRFSIMAPEKSFIGLIKLGDHNAM